MLRKKFSFSGSAKVLFIVIIALQVVACSTTSRMYSGPERPLSETALVQCGNPTLSITSCDGTKVTSSNIIILPGQHTLEIFFRTLGHEGYYGNFRLGFTAEAGHTYVVDQTKDYLPQIHDKTTDKWIPVTR
jgi:hypothetical protein